MSWWRKYATVGRTPLPPRITERVVSDEATQETENSTLSTNEIIEDTRSTQEEFNNGHAREMLGMIQSERRIDSHEVWHRLDGQATGDSLSMQSTIPNSLSAEELSADNYFRNAYYVFRALCKLSDREIKDKTNTDPKYALIPFALIVCSHTDSRCRTNLDLKSRIFSLRLIMQILQTSGPIFRASEDFLFVIKTYLCVSLSRNGVSSIPELFEMALFNFVELLDKFKAHLKIQIEVRHPT